MTLMQRILKTPLNWLVNTYFPKGAVYGNEYFDIFREVNQPESVLGHASVLWIIHNMHLLEATELTFELDGITINGELVGDFRIVGTLIQPEDKT